MSSTGGSLTKLLLVLGIVLLVGAAWIGGRMTAPSSGSHMSGMMHAGRAAGAPDAPFDGAEGAARCRAMMASMGDMHRSMRSMMEGKWDQVAAPDTGDHSSRMGGGMMRGQMKHGGGAMGDRGQKKKDGRGHMGGMGHGQMGHMGGMDMDRMGQSMTREEMRGLCRAMHATMQDVMHGDTPSTSGDSSSGNDLSEWELDSKTEEWLREARGFETVEDRTGASEVVVEVGAGTGLSYAPAAVRVDPGTTVRWRWTGTGGLHDVAFENTDVEASLRGEQGETFTHTFASPGEYRYTCTPHAAVGMQGVVIVEE